MGKGGGEVGRMGYGGMGDGDWGWVGWGAGSRRCGGSAAGGGVLDYPHPEKYCQNGLEQAVGRKGGNIPVGFRGDQLGDGMRECRMRVYVKYWV